jgi:hypothetical protein
VHEDLLNAVSNLVHRHVLVTLHAMTGAMLAQLDACGEVDLGGKAPTPEPTKPAVAAPSPKPSTLERKQRRQRAKQRQAANGATAPVTAGEDHWPALRGQFHAEIRRRHMTRGQIAAELGVSKGSVCGWLVPTGAPPSAGNIGKIRAWLDKPAPKPPEPEAAAEKVGRPGRQLNLAGRETAAKSAGFSDRSGVDGHGWPALRLAVRERIARDGLTYRQVATVFECQPSTLKDLLSPRSPKVPGARLQVRLRRWLASPEPEIVVPAEDLPIYTLTASEQTLLTGHLSLAGNGRELREQFGATRELLEQAAGGAHLHVDVIAKLRLALTNGAVAG